MPGPLLATERRARLLEILGRDGAIRLDPAAIELGVSGMTVRRDLADLEAEGLVQRVRGGAVTALQPRPFGERMSIRSAPKRTIARKALELVPPAGAIAADASSTTSALLSLIEARDLMVVTNSADNEATARRRPGVRSILVGGELQEHTGSFVGGIACLVAGSLSYDYFFSSAAAVDPDFGSSEVSLEESQVKVVFAGRSRATVLLADSSKLGQAALSRALEWETIDVLVTELDPADPRLDPYRYHVELR